MPFCFDVISHYVLWRYFFFYLCFEGGKLTRPTLRRSVSSCDRCREETVATTPSHSRYRSKFPTTNDEQESSVPTPLTTMTRVKRLHREPVSATLHWYSSPLCWLSFHRCSWWTSLLRSTNFQRFARYSSTLTLLSSTSSRPPRNLRPRRRRFFHGRLVCTKSCTLIIERFTNEI